LPECIFFRLPGQNQTFQGLSHLLNIFIHGNDHIQSRRNTIEANHPVKKAIDTTVSPYNKL
jgi:hypothetical protein